MARRPASPRSARRAAQRRRRRRRTAVVVGALGIAAAAAAVVTSGAVFTSGDDTRVASAPPVDRTTTSTLPTTTTTARDPRRGNGQAVTFAFGGDIHFEQHIREKLLADPSALLSGIAPVLSLADVAMVNLETTITEADTPIPKEWNFKAPVVALDAIRAAGVDVATEANNHSVDFGPPGFADTLAARVAKQFPVIGIGANAAEAYAPYRAEIKGQRIAIFGATDVIGEEHVASWTATETQAGIASTKYDSQTVMIAWIQAVRPEVDTVVVFLHWGVERENCPSTRQKELARALVDAGADIVVGSHAHHLQGAGRLGTAFVGYGLGNFVFFNESGEYGRSGVLVVTATGRDVDSYRWVPARIRGGVPQPLPAGAEADAELAHWNELRACTDLAP